MGKRLTTWAPGASATVVLSLALALILAGVTIVTAMVSSRLIGDAGNSTGLMVTVASWADDSIPQLERELVLMPSTATTAVITRDQALEQWKKDTGEDLVQLLGENPLSSTIDVTVKEEWSSTDSLESLAQQVEQMPEVASVKVCREQSGAISRNASSLLTMIGIAATLMLVIAVALVVTTVRLQMNSRRHQIQTMKLVGATPWFVARPFVIRASLSGALAAVIASALIAAMWALMASSGNELWRAAALCITPWQLVAVSAVLIAGAVLVCSVASAVAASRHHDDV
ncbi:MAG: permease-like cell division protein FtsX [Bacteroidales bacterium]|nr:permease-like cell division protein FtsX [Candidatus Sodaliphilus aphodohippi]